MIRRGRLIALEGGSAAGKTTLVRTAARSLGWRALSEAFDRLDPAPSLEFDSAQALLRLEATLLAEEGRRYREARRRCDRGETVLADTGFLGPLTYTVGLVERGWAPVSVGRALRRSVRAMIERGTLGIPDLTVYLSTTAAERRRRSRAGARRHPPALFPRHEAVGALERRYFETVFPEAVPGRFRVLRAQTGPASLVHSLRELVERDCPPRSSRVEALGLVALLRLPAGTGRHS